MLFFLPLQFYPILFNFFGWHNRPGLKLFYSRIFAQIYRESILCRGDFAPPAFPSIFVEKGNKNGNRSPYRSSGRDRKGVLKGKKEDG